MMIARQSSDLEGLLLSALPWQYLSLSRGLPYNLWACSAVICCMYMQSYYNVTLAYDDSRTGHKARLFLAALPLRCSLSVC